MIPDYPCFKAFDIEDISEITQVVISSHLRGSEFAPANFYIWQDFEVPLLTKINNNLCIMIRCRGQEYFLEPLGDNNLTETLDICLKQCGRLSWISESMTAKVDATRTKITSTPELFDYLYRRSDLAEMKGSRYDGKRNHIKRFKAAFPDWVYQPLTMDTKIQALSIFDFWSTHKTDSVSSHYAVKVVQRMAIERAFSAFNKLKISGGYVKSEGRMLGFIMGSRLNANTAVVHFHYGLPEALGIMPLLLQEAMRSTFSDYEFINLEQDIGIAGLRKSKLSYHPVDIINKYQIDCI